MIGVEIGLEIRHRGVISLCEIEDKTAVVVVASYRSVSWAAEPGGGGGGGCGPVAPQFLPNFFKISLFASNFGISMTTAPPRSS